MKPFKLIFLAFMLIGMSSCSGRSGAVPTGASDLASKSHVGCLSIIKGHSSASGGGKENFLYLMIVCPEIKNSDVRESSSGINGDPMSKPEIDHSWTTSNGIISVPVFWNTSTEDLLIGENKFNRTNGNVFTVIRTSDGKVAVKQCGTLQSHAEYKEAVLFIREHCATNKVISDVKFYEVDP